MRNIPSARRACATAAAMLAGFTLLAPQAAAAGDNRNPNDPNNPGQRTHSVHRSQQHMSNHKQR